MRPTSVKVGGYEYRVRWDGRGLKKGTLGLCNFDRQEIAIRRGLPPQSQRSVLLHEVLHAVLDNSGFAEGMDEETVVCRLESGIFGLIVDNPDLCDWIAS